jgi:hypothetical protein
MEGTLALLMDSGLTNDYWGLAMQTYVYLKNKSPHKALYRTTPHELWTGKKPNLSHLRVFGTMAYVRVRREVYAGSKLAPKAELLRFVGYSDQHKAFKFIDTEMNGLVYSSEAKFINEHISAGNITSNTDITQSAGNITPNTDITHVACPVTSLYDSITSNPANRSLYHTGTRGDTDTGTSRQHSYSDAPDISPVSSTKVAHAGGTGNLLYTRV